jgi:hypothetical protein
MQTHIGEDKTWAYILEKQTETSFTAGTTLKTDGWAN